MLQTAPIIWGFVIVCNFMNIPSITLNTSNLRTKKEDTLNKFSIYKKRTLRRIRSKIKRGNGNGIDPIDLTEKRERKFSARFVGAKNLISRLRKKRAEKEEKDFEVSNKRSFIKKPAVFAKNLFRPLAVAFVAGLVLVGAINIIGGLGKGEDSVEKVSVKGLRASNDINKEYDIPLINGEGTAVSNVKYVIEKAELRDELIYQGQKATAVAGRTFLILNLKIINEHSEGININTKDYVRLSVNGNENEWLAPDMHNDPVEVQAISTKYTRVGFPINENDTDHILRFGEITGDKEIIELEL
jgi:hypothetical protein